MLLPRGIGSKCSISDLPLSSKESSVMIDPGRLVEKRSRIRVTWLIMLVDVNIRSEGCVVIKFQQIVVLLNTCPYFVHWSPLFIPCPWFIFSRESPSSSVQSSDQKKSDDPPYSQITDAFRGFANHSTSSAGNTAPQRNKSSPNSPFKLNFVQVNTYKD